MSRRKPSTGTLTLRMVDDRNGSGTPNWGDRITYDIANGGQYPYVTTVCTVNGQNVLTAFAGFYPEYMWQGARIVTLQSDVWTGGPADCVATLQGGASLPFRVEA